MSTRYIGGLVYNPPGGWSGFFDGSGDWITAPSNAAFGFGTGDFTIEAWVYWTGGSGENTFFCIDVTNGVNIFLNASSNWGIGTRAVAVNNFFGTPPTQNAWRHLAVSRSGSTIYAFINGMLVYSGANTINYATGSASIAAIPTASGNIMSGYISNLRVLKGTGLYTTSFTPPTGPLQAITNTSLLTCRYPTFVDGSTNAFTLTVSGNTAVNTLNPFPTSVLPNPALGNAGNGIYTMSQYASLLGAGTWPAIDPYYENVTLNLHGNAGAVLPFNTDASTNNFQVTQFGDTRPSNLTPFITNGYWSNLFTGTSNSNYLSIPRILDSTVDITLECWICMTSTAPANGAYIAAQYVAAGADRTVFIVSSGVLALQIGSTFVTGTIAISVGSWNHVAFVRSGNGTNNWSIYVNGVRDGQMTYTGTYQNTPFTIGATNNLVSTQFPGYISNLRLLKGTALYSGASFTPPTAPLTAITNTALLTCQSNRIIDNSASPNTITVNGTVSVDPYQPFTAPTGTSTYGSGYFDGTGDWLTPPTGQTALTLGTSDFTIEMWAYPTTQVRGNPALFTSDPGAGLANTILVQFIGTTGQTILWVNNTNLTASSTTNYIRLNQWNHIAICRSGGNTYTFYINGVAVNNVATNSTSLTTSSWYLGYWTVADNAYTGYLSNFRIVKGTVVYTGAFTPPTSPLTAITNTSLLTVQTNAPSQNNTFLDSSTNNFPITRNGNTTQGTFSPYGNRWSNYFTSGTYLTFPDSQAFNLSGGSYTVECWVNPTGNYSNYNTILAKRSGDSSGTFGWELFLFIGTGVVSYATNYGTAVSTGITLTANVWSHVAVVYDGTNASIYINGTRYVVGSTANTNVSSSVYVGTYPPYSEQFLGYLSDVRITKGATLYTGTSFTVPTAPLTTNVPSGNVVLLTCQDNRFRDNSAANSATTVTGSLTVQKFSPYPLATQSYTSFGASFDGSGDYVTAPSNAAFALGTGDYTFETWIYKTTSVRVNIIAMSGGQGFAVAVNTSGNIEVCRAGTAIDYTFTAGISNNTWTHIAVTRSGTSLRAFKDGTLLGTQTSSNNYGQGICYIGIDTGGTGDTFAGSMSNFRLVKGTAIYTASFTVPTTPLTAVSGTSLLTLQSSSFIDNSSNAFTLTSYGTAQPIQASPFSFSMLADVAYSTSVISGSGYFDGSGDYLTPATSPAFAYGTGDLTFECWIYATTASDSPIYESRSTNSNTDGFTVTAFSSTVIRVYTTAVLVTATVANYTNAWTHVAYTRQGSTNRLFVNGLLVATATASDNFSNTTAFIGAGRYATSSPSAYFTGYISNVRILKGSALYTTSFVPNSAPLTTIANTSLLLNYTNAAIFDNAMTSDLETVANAQLSTSIKKYGSASMYFDGSGDYLSIPSSLNFAITNIFTVECWLYLNAVPTGSVAMYVADFRGGSTNNYAFGVVNSGSNTILYGYLGSTGGEIRGSINITTGGWYHLAFVNTGSTLTGYLNGLSQGTLSTSYNQGATNVIIGARYTGGTEYVNGYIDDLRITKGVARYTTTFTPPTSQVQDQ
jgi:hypothetical protein